MLKKSYNEQNILKKYKLHTVFILIKEQKLCKTLGNTQIVGNTQIFIKNNHSVVYFTNFMYHDNNKPISQVKISNVSFVYHFQSRQDAI